MTAEVESDAGGRHRGREVALQVLYAIDLAETGRRDGLRARGEGDVAVSRGMETVALDELERELVANDPVAASESAFDRVAEHFVVPRSALAFGRALVGKVIAQAESLDAVIALHARNWRVSRMTAVDRNVLRLAVYELRDTDTPVAVVIDEAVDLARRFGADTSPAFVNGVLDAVAREVRAA